MDVGELFVKLGFKVDTKDLKDFNSGMRDTLKTALQLAGVTASAVGFKNLLGGAASAAVALDNLSLKYAHAADSAQRFASAVQIANPNATRESALAAYENIARFVGEMPLKGAGALQFFGGTTADNTPEKVIERIRQNFAAVEKRWGRQQAINWVREITGTDDALNALLLTTEDYKRATEKGLIPPEALQNLKEYGSAVQDLGVQFDVLKAKWLSLPAKAIADFLKRGNEDGYLQAWGDTVRGAARNVAQWAHREGQMSKYYRDMEKDFISQGVSPDEAHRRVMEVKERAARAEAAKAAGGGNAQDTARKFFTSMGWTPAQAAGIVQGLMSESGLRPDVYGNGIEAQGMPKEAYGIAQWQRARQKDFELWAGKSIKDSTFQEQMQFVHYELTRGKERAAGEMLKRQADQFNSFRVFKNDYERPSEQFRVREKVDIHVYPRGDAQDAANATMRAYQQTNLGAAY